MSVNKRIEKLENEIQKLQKDLKDYEDAIFVHEHVERKADETDQIFRMIVEEISDAVYLVDEEGDFLYIPKKDKLLGYNFQEVRRIGNIFKLFKHIFFTPESFNGTTEINNYKLTTITKKGETKDILINLKKTNFRKGAILVICHDDTEELPELKKLKVHKHLFDQASVGIGYYTKEGKVISYNEKAAQDIGGRPSDFVGKSFLELFGEEGNIYQERLDKTVDTKKENEFHDIVQLGDNTIHFITNYKCVFNEDNEIEGVQLISRNVTDIKIAQEEIAKKNKILEKSQNIAKYGWWDFNLVTQEVEVSDELLKIYGRTREDGTPNMDIWIEETVFVEDKERVQNAISKAIKNCGVFELTYRINRKDNNKVSYINTRGEVIANAENEPLKIIGVVQDITAKEAQENLLAESEKKYRTLVETSPDGIIALNKLGIITEINQVFADLTGFEKADFLGKHVLTLPTLLKQDLDFYAKLIKKIFNGEKLGPITFKWKHANGEIHDGEARTSLLRKHQKIIGIQAIVRDITDAKQAELKLINSEERFRTLFENMEHGAFWQNADGSLENVNQAALNIFGLTEDEFLGRTSMNPQWKVMDINGNDVPGEQHPSMKALKTGKEIKNELLAVYNPIKKEFVWIHINAKPLFKDNKKKPTKVFVTLHDVTHLKQTEFELAERESQFKKISELSSDYSYSIMVNENGTMEHEWSFGAFERITGYDPIKIWKDGTIEKFFHPDDANILADRVQRQLKGETVISEVRIITKSGEVKWIRDIGEPIWDEEKTRVIRIIGTAQDITEQKLAQNAVLESEERFRTSFEASKIGIGIISPEGILISINKATSKILGYTKKELLGKNFLEFTHPEDVENSRKHFKQSINDKKTFTINKRYVAKNKEIKSAVTTVSPIFNESGELKYVIAHMHDITELKASQHDSELKQKHLESLINNPAGYAIYRLELILETNEVIVPHVSPSIVDVLGLNKKDVKVFDNWFKFVHPEDIGNLIQNHENAKKPPFKFAVEFRYNHPKKGLRWLEVRSQAIPFEDNPNIPQYANGIILDLTEQKQAQVALGESEEKYRTLIESSNDMIFVIKEGRIIFANNQLLKTSEYSEKEVLGKPFLNFVHESEVTRITNFYKYRIAGKKVPNRYESKAVTKTGKVIDVEIIVVFIEFEGEKAEHVVMRDITERKTIEKALFESEAKYRSTLNSMADAIHVIDKDFKIQLHNEKFEHLARQTGMEINVKKGDDLFKNFPFLDEKIKNEYKKVFETGKILLTQEIFSFEEKQFFTETRKIPVFENDKVEQIITIVRNVTNQKQTEKAILESEIKYRSLFENAPIMLGLIDGNGQYEQVNEAVFNILGYPVESLVNKNSFSLVHEDDLDKVVEAFNKVKESGVGDVVYRFKHKNGNFRTIYSKASSIHETEQFLVYSIDVTEQYEAEEKLKRSEELLKKAEKVSKQGSWKWDIVNDNWTFSENWLKIHGFNRSGISSKELMKIAHPDDRNGIEMGFENAINKKKPFSQEGRIVRQDNGEVRYIKALGEVFFFANGNPNFMIGVAQDITESKSIENALRDSEAKYRQLVETASDAIYLMAENGKVIDTNICACQLLGYTKKEILQLTIGDIDPNYPLDDFIEFWKNTPFDEQRIFETTHKRKDGVLIPVEVSGKKFKQNEEVFYYGVARDLTIRKESENELIKSKEELSKLQEAAKIGGWEWDLTSNKIIWADKEIHNLLGIDQNLKLTADLAEKAIHSEDVEKVWEADKKAIKTKNYTNQEYRIVQQNGNIIWVIAKGMFVYDKNDNPINYIGTLQDITERKNTEQALKESEEKYKGVIEYSNIGIALGNYKGDIIEVNKEFEKIIGYREKELIKMNFSEFSYPDDLEAEYLFLKEMEEGKRSNYRLEKRYIHKNKSIIWVDISVTGQFDEQGKILGFIGMVIDITPKKRAEEAMRLSEERFRELVNTINSGVAIYKVINDGKSGNDYIIQEFNPFSLKHEALNKEEVVGKSLKEIRPNIDDYGLIDVFRKVWKTGKPEFFPAKIYVDEKWSNYYENRVFRLPSGEIVAIYDDVSEQKAAEIALRENERKLQDMANSMPGLMLQYKLNIDGSDELLYLSKNVEKIYEIPQEIAFKNVNLIWERIHQDDLEEFRKSVEESAKKLSFWEFEHRAVLESGETKWIHQRGTPYKSDDGGIIWNTLSIDITERKKAEAALKESERNLKAAQSMAKVGHWSWDVNNDIVYWSDEVYRIFGTEIGNILNYEKLLEFIHPDDKEYHNQLTEEWLKGNVQPYEYRIIPEPNTMKYVYAVGEVEFNDNKEAIYMYGSLQDITDRKLSEKELEKYKNELEALVKDRTRELEEKYKELEEKNKELERYNELFVGREFRIKELRQKIKELEKKNKDA